MQRSQSAGSLEVICMSDFLACAALVLTPTNLFKAKKAFVSFVWPKQEQQTCSGPSLSWLSAPEQRQASCPEQPRQECRGSAENMILAAAWQGHKVGFRQGDFQRYTCLTIVIHSHSVSCFAVSFTLSLQLSSWPILALR